MSAYHYHPEWEIILWPDFLPGPPAPEDCILAALLAAWALMLWRLWA